MFELIFWIILGVTIFIAAPIAISRVTRSPLPGLALRALGLLAIIWGVASTSYIHISDGTTGKMFHVYGGGSMPPGYARG